MKKKNAKVVVRQFDNPCFHPNAKIKDHQFLYTVTQAVNTLNVHIGEVLNPSQIERLIALDITVTINGNTGGNK